MTDSEYGRIVAMVNALLARHGIPASNAKTTYAYHMVPTGNPREWAYVPNLTSAAYFNKRW